MFSPSQRTNDDVHGRALALLLPRPISPSTISLHYLPRLPPPSVLPSSLRPLTRRSPFHPSALSLTLSSLLYTLSIPLRSPSLSRYVESRYRDTTSRGPYLPASYWCPTLQKLFICEHEKRVVKIYNAACQLMSTLELDNGGRGDKIDDPDELRLSGACKGKLAGGNDKPVYALCVCMCVVCM